MKHELQAPTLVEAELVRSNGQRLRGQLHLPAAAASHDGPPRADEWLNGPGLFFPFRPRGSKKPTLFNKADVLVLSVPAEANAFGGLEAAQPPKQPVEVECDDRTMRGAVAIDMPEGEDQLMEFVNHPEPFLTLRAGQRHQLVQKRLITKLTEIEQ